MANDDLILGKRTAREIAEYLTLIGDEESAERFRAAEAAVKGMGAGWDAFLGKDQWAYGSMVVGFVDADDEHRVGISNANAIEADQGLRGKRVKISLEGFYVQSYPGSGKHRILCEFSGRNQVAGESEELKFALTVEARDGEGAAIQGKPIFMGVTIGDDGLNFMGETVNVSSSEDDVILDALNSDAFKQGLALATMVQPALKPFTGLATGVVKAVLGRSKNKKVFKFDLGLDFNKSHLSVRLRRGSYVIVQKGAGDWKWENFEFERATRQIYRKADGEPLELNYLVVGVDDFLGEPAPPKAPPKARAPRP
ncbi:hypothetical protein [Methylobacterium haplocladii]|uniref:Uncharacterized protein n=1 Tax=Methylobacterium haplocladii TaxID=1176176 RepID=A0A512IV43_9HYPH|nr:hypothetical protein [Methylobacterium haplocladii]GEP01499.1 hypothetical protein MHA02_38860 [Methylobacterium haplocladii]GJD82317.1 hypothetical protein HPGCJGGD_0169 [Methylobacterium haplocladii]GLS59150.1 hypothetical protein GCM10007887_18160 [Methylobacterium haplocladii]